MNLRYLLLLVGFCFSAAPVFSQVPEEAVESFHQALRAKGKKQHDDAAMHMKAAISKYPAYTEAYSLYGQWLAHQRRYTEAISIFRTASRNCPDGHKAFAKPLARCLADNYDYRGAQQLASQYAMPGDEDWARILRRAAFMEKHFNNRRAEKAMNMGLGINSPYPEMFPCMTADTSVIYFTRLNNGMDEDFYRSTPDSCGGWFYARNMGEPLNTPAMESAMIISVDGHYMFLTRCNNKSENGWAKGGCDLLMAYTSDTVWSVPQSFGATINTVDYEGMGCLSPDNRELYFVSDRPGGYGGFDIWVSRFDNGYWRLPRNLGPEVNTPGNETAPFIHTDNKTFFFASDGHPGFGGTDLYHARRINDTLWSAPENLNYPFNTTANETSLFVTVDGDRAYFASDRDSVEGNFDIYQIEMPAELKPQPVALVQGYVYDSIGKQRLNYTSIYITDLWTDNQIYHFTSNRGDGSFMITLPLGRQYLYQADRIGYLDASDTLDLTGLEVTGTLNKDIPLLPHDYVKPVEDSTIAIIYFPINSAVLSDSDKAVIQEAIMPWKDKEMVVMVNGYTDNTGTPMINEQLSYMRAGLVAKELEALKLENARISSQGWGEAMPVDSNETEEGRNRNRRVEIVVRW